MSAYIGCRYADDVAINTAGMAAYEQVADAIRRDIKSGRLSVGSKLRSHRELAEQYGVALGTAQKAVRLLQDEGWLVARASVGVFVAEAPADGQAVTLASLNERLTSLHAEVAGLKERIDRIEDAAR
jgi:DNA-binding GntR family transcriptional regulator